MLCIGIALIHIFHRLMFPEKGIRLAWIILLAMFVVIVIYVLNPKGRVYSVHGFFRTAIVHQIMNGDTPPLDALFAGQVVRSPWGFPWLVAQITRAFDITPFYSFAVVNVVSLGLVLLLCYRISGLLVRDQKANVLSAIVSVFGTTIFSFDQKIWLKQTLNIVIECRGLPVFEKFSNINGVPIGLVFFLLFIYTVIKIFQHKNIWPCAVGLLVSILGCGFFYPPMMPGIVAGAVAVCVVHLVLFRTDYFGKTIKPIIVMVAAVIGGCLLLGPYMLSVSSGVSKKIELCNLWYLYRNSVNYIVLAGPLWIVILINGKFLMRHVNMRAFAILLTIAIATGACFVFIHIPDSVEYKFMILSTVTLGILGGISFNKIRQWRYKSVAMVLLILFIMPAVTIASFRLGRYEDLPVIYEEKGRYIVFAEPEENELYEWIGDNTAGDRIFVDSEMKIPVFARRCLLIGIDKPDGSIQIGYGMKMARVRLRHGYDPDLYMQRQKLVRNIYGYENTLTSEEIMDSLRTQDVYVVTRGKASGNVIDRNGFEEIFKSSKGNFIVLKPQPRTH